MSATQTPTYASSASVALMVLQARATRSELRLRALERFVRSASGAGPQGRRLRVVRSASDTYHGRASIRSDDSELARLRAYVVAHGVRGPQEGWSDR